MRYIKMMLTGLLGLAILATVIGLLMPSSVKISRGVILETDSAQVEQLLLDADRWNEWMPWVYQSEGLLVQKKGVNRESGFEFNWQALDGKNTGRITYIGRTPGILSFKYEFKDMNKAEGGFRIRKIAEGRTELQWFLEYPLRWYPWERFYGIFVDSMIGSVLETGLQNFLKIFASPSTTNS
jgi:hypothetical protein